MTHKREDNFDLTKFLKKDDVRIIANPEGFDIAKLISKDGEDIQNANAIICGNIMDSTNNKGNDGKDLSIKGKCPYFRILIKKRIRKNKKINQITRSELINKRKLKVVYQF